MEEREMPTRSWSISPEFETAKCPGRGGRLILFCLYLQKNHTKSVEDCNISVDITLKSIDEITFGAHQKNLEFYSQGFPIAGSTVATEVVQLQEKADVLRIMLIFMHNTRLPDLNKLEFSIISPLAEAAEKYMIYSAIALCRIKMEFVCYILFHLFDANKGLRITDKKSRSIQSRFSCIQRSMGILAWLILLHKWLWIFQPRNFSDLHRRAILIKILLSDGYVPDTRCAQLWALIYIQCRYRDLWLDTLFRRVLTTDGLSPCLASGSHKKGKTSCNLWHKFHLQVIKHIGQKLTELSRFGDVLERSRAGLDVCSECRSNIEIWRRQVQAAVQKMPNFSNA